TTPIARFWSAPPKPPRSRTKNVRSTATTPTATAFPTSTTSTMTPTAFSTCTNMTVSGATRFSSRSTRSQFPEAPESRSGDHGVAVGEVEPAGTIVAGRVDDLGEVPAGTRAVAVGGERADPIVAGRDGGHQAVRERRRGAAPLIGLDVRRF